MLGVTSPSADISSSVQDVEENFVSNPVQNPSSYKTISASDLNDLFEQEGRLKNALILDIRRTLRFNKKHVKNSVNIPNAGSNGNERFPTKASVMKYVLDYLPSHIVNINAPGHYDEIIVYDEYSHDKSICDSLNIMVKAILKWNEDTVTEICLLNGGFQSVKKNFPNLVTSINKLGFPAPPTNSPSIIKKVPTKSAVHPGPRKAAEILATFHFYIRAMDEAIKKTREKIELQRKLKVLEEIDPILKAEESKELRNAFDKLIDDPYKCQICKVIFPGIIYRCINGRSICPNCSAIPRHIEQCRFPVEDIKGDFPEISPNGRKIRSFRIEKLMATTVVVSCPNDNGCGQSLKGNQISGHIIDCLRNRGPAGKWVEEKIQSMKGDTVVLSKQLKDVRNRMLEMESEWLEIMEKDDTPGLPRGFGKQIYTKKTIFNQLQITLELETVLKTGKRNMKTESD